MEFNPIRRLERLEPKSIVLWSTIVVFIVLAISITNPAYCLSLETDGVYWDGVFDHHHPVYIAGNELTFSYSSLDNCFKWGSFMIDQEGEIKGIIEYGPINTIAEFSRCGFWFVCPNEGLYHMFDSLDNWTYLGSLLPEMILETWEFSREELLQFVGGAI